MNARVLAALLVGNAARLFRSALPMALAATLAMAIMACSPFAKASSGHACADKVAAALAASQPTAGAWNCTSPSLQQSFHAYGYDGDKALAGALPAVGGATYVGSAKDMVTYAYTVRTTSGSTKTVEVVLWIDDKGLVTNLGLATPIF